MATGTGAQARYALAIESSYGVEVARTLAMAVKGFEIATAAENVVVDDLEAYKAGPGEMVQLSTKVEGYIEFNPAYAKNLLGIVLYLVFGSVVETGSGPYTHTFAPSTSGSLPSASGEGNRGAARGDTEEAYGIQATKLTITTEAGKQTTARLDIIAQSTSARATQTVPATQNGRTYLTGAQLAGVVFGGTTYKTRKVVVTFDNALEGLRDTGSLTIAEAVRSGRMMVTVEAELTQREVALYADHRAGTQRTLAMTWTYDTNTTLAFTSNLAFIETYSDPVTTVGAVVERVKWVCLADRANTTAIATMALKNGDSTYDAS